MGNNLKFPSLEDMAWAIASPPMMEPEHAECSWYSARWFQSMHSASETFFSQQEKHHEAMQALLCEQKDQRLGKYFECLWLYWLLQGGRYDVIEHNLAIRDGGTTLGELDFLVLDKVSRQYIHWELAVKFYLGVDDTRQPHNWLGPGKKDRLDKKVEHLMHHQSVLTNRAAVKEILHEKGLKVDKCGVIFKGRLFYPNHVQDAVSPRASSRQHLRSSWYTLSNFESEITESDALLPLLGFGWLALPEYTESQQVLGKIELLNLLKSNVYRLPLCVAQGHGGVWRQQIFIVEDDWELTDTVE